VFGDSRETERLVISKAVLLLLLLLLLLLSLSRKVAGSRPDGVNDFYQFT
jgi:hypothetical protein